MFKNLCKKSLFLLYITIASVLFAQENKTAQIDKSLQNNFIIIESVQPHELNPQITSYASDAQLLTGLYEGLFTYNPITLEPQYAIATDFKISRDKKRWIFTLNENARFSNGEKITAEHVRASWLQLLATPQAPYASLLDVIKGAEEFRNGKCTENEVCIFAKDEKTLSLSLVKPANYLPKLLCHSAFSIIHRNPTVYSGPFSLEDMDQISYVLKKNPYYWDAENTPLEAITILQCDDENENAYYFNTGMVDWLNAPVNTEKLLNKKAFLYNGEFATSYLFFKDSKAKSIKGNKGSSTSVWDYVEFRQALLEAIPWEQLRTGYGIPASTLVYPLTGYPEVEGFYYTDLEEAKRLMSAARKKHGIPEDTKLPLVMEVSEKAFSEEKLNLFRDCWSELGIDFQVKAIPPYQYLANVDKSNSDILCYTWIGDFADPLAFLELFRTGSTLNPSGWSNKKFDDLLEQAAQVSEQERYNLLAQAEGILLDSYEIIPLYHPVIYNIINLQEVGGWATNAFDIHPLKYLFRKAPAAATGNIVKK